MEVVQYKEGRGEEQVEGEGEERRGEPCAGEQHAGDNAGDTRR